MGIQLVLNAVQAILEAGSHLLSTDHITSWLDLTSDAQRQTANRLLMAVETSAFLRANLSQSPQTILVDYNNIGSFLYVLRFYVMLAGIIVTFVFCPF